MVSFRGFLLAAATAAVAWVAPAEAVTRQEVTINGFKVWRYVWVDSHGRNRSVSLKKEGEGNSGHGGYAIQMVYVIKVGATTKQIIANAENGEGFGYFVSHERFRKFSDGDSDSIANKIFGKDDSPLGRIYPVTTRGVATGPHKGIIQFKLNYPHYGTIAAAGFDDNTGEDSPPLGTSPALYKLYNLPVSITWYFQDGRDYPRIVTKIDMSAAPGPDRLSFDLRGPYGKLDFDVGDNPIRQVLWADRFLFKTTQPPLSRNVTWTWNQPNSAARFTSLIAGTGEMGLLEPVAFAKSALNDGYSDGRGKTSSTYNCLPDQRIPCDYEWPYQSSQYELPYDDINGPTTSEKIAWGSISYYGMSIASTYDGTTSTPFEGFPPSKSVQYQVCVVLGQFVAGGLTRTTAAAGGNYNCADTSLN